MINIIKYEDKYLEDIKDLLVELEEYIISIDRDNLDQLHPEYRDKMTILDLEEINNSDGICYLALKDEKVVGLIMGCIVKYDEYDYLDYKCPKMGEVTELVVSKNVRKSGIGQLLIDKIEQYFKNKNCEYIKIDVFSYNKNAINFYEKNNYHNRMETKIKKIKIVDNIKTPEDILKFLNKNIDYGWVDIDGNKHIKEMKNFRKLYRTMSIEDTLKNGVGTCIEQVYLMKYLLDKLNIKNKMFCTRIYEPNDFNNLDEEEHMHCFILYYLNDRVYQIEHPNYYRIGIYEFNNEKEAIDKINEYYINLSGKIARPVTRFYKVEPGLSFKEFNNYINNLDNIKLKQVEKQDISLLDNLMQLYLHELSNDFKIDFNNKICKYEYDLKPYFENNKAYFILNNNDIVGFILLDINEDSFEISEIFILNNYKKQGIAKKAVYKLFNMYEGSWVVKAVPNSKTAENFWLNVIKEYTNNKFELEHIGKYERAIFKFKSKKVLK